MLKQRVVTAVVLVIALLGALLAPQAWPFAVLMLVMVGAASWEWGRLNQATAMQSVLMGGVTAGACALAWAGGYVATAAPWVWWAACAVWVLGAAWAIRSGSGAWPRMPRAARWLLGGVMLWVAWLALSSARVAGVNFVLSIFCLVWVADIAAYFGGRAFGKRKLAPAISPGKSWEGVWSGMLGVQLLAFGWLYLDQQGAGRWVDSASLYTALRDTLGMAGMMLALVFLAAMSVVGDLVESLVKRSAGAKDSSNLLPGHGGVLDRIDALVPVFPIAMALSTL